MDALAEREARRLIEAPMILAHGMSDLAGMESEKPFLAVTPVPAYTSPQNRNVGASGENGVLS